MNPSARSATEKHLTSVAIPATQKPIKKRRLRRVVMWVTGVLLFLMLLVVAAVVFRDSLVRVLAEYNLRDETGMPAEIGSLQIGLGTSSVRLTDLRIMNPPEFGGSVFIEIPEIFLKLSADQTTTDQIVFEEIRFHLATVNVVKNEQGKTNLDALKETQRIKKKRKKRKRDPGIAVGGVGKLTVSLGTLRFIDLGDPAKTTQIDLNVDHEVMTGIQSEADLNARLIALLTRVALEQYYRQGRSSRGQLRELLLQRLNK